MVPSIDYEELRQNLRRQFHVTDKIPEDADAETKRSLKDMAITIAVAALLEYEKLNQNARSLSSKPSQTSRPHVE